MLKMDAIDLFDLSEAGRLLFRDPVRLAREARLQRIPSTRVDGALGLPSPWVEAEAGIAPVDADSLRDYWLTRLAPPSRGGHRARRERDRLPAEHLLTPAEAARRLLCDERALERLALDQTLPPLRIDGELRYDAALVGLVADDAAGIAETGNDATPGTRAALEARWSEVVLWARFDYVTEVALPTNRVEAVLPPTLPPTVSPTGPVERPPTPSVGAYEIPADLGLDRIEDLPEERPPSTLSDADGFETIDED